VCHDYLTGLWADQRCKMADETVEHCMSERPLCIQYVPGLWANGELLTLELYEQILMFDRQHVPVNSECTGDVEFHMQVDCSKESCNSPTLNGLKQLLSLKLFWSPRCHESVSNHECDRNKTETELWSGCGETDCQVWHQGCVPFEPELLLYWNQYWIEHWIVELSQLLRITNH
jgi:hypothetical protein